MDITITLSARQQAGLKRATAAFNLQQPIEQQLTDEQYAMAELSNRAKQWEQFAPDSIPTAEWLSRWTTAEKRAALLFATSSEQVLTWWLTLLETVNFRYDDSTAQQGVPALLTMMAQQGGIIADGETVESRTAAIMAY